MKRFYVFHGIKTHTQHFKSSYFIDQKKKKQKKKTSSVQRELRIAENRQNALSYDATITIEI